MKFFTPLPFCPKRKSKPLFSHRLYFQCVDSIPLLITATAPPPSFTASLATASVATRSIAASPFVAPSLQFSRLGLDIALWFTPFCCLVLCSTCNSIQFHSEAESFRASKSFRPLNHPDQYHSEAAFLSHPKHQISDKVYF